MEWTMEACIYFLIWFCVRGREGKILQGFMMFFFAYKENVAENLRENIFRSNYCKQIINLDLFMNK